MTLIANTNHNPSDPVAHQFFFDNRPTLAFFICNHCPYVRYRMKAIAAIAKDYEDRFNVVAINSNSDTHDEDAKELMPDFKEEFNLTCKYYADPAQQIAKAFGAVCTPDYFVLDRDRYIVYNGELDPARMTNTLSPTGSTLRYVLDQVIVGEEVVIKTKGSFGCSIKWKE